MIHALTDRPHLVVPARADAATAAIAAAGLLLPHLERGRRIDASRCAASGGNHLRRSPMPPAPGTGKPPRHACEAATVLFLRRYGPALRRRAPTPAAMLPLIDRIASLLPTHTRRSVESQALQQFSTPLGLGLAAATAAAIGPKDLVLEPSAGTGLLTIFAELAGGALVLNELRRDPRRDPGRAFCRALCVPARRGADP